MEVLLVAIAAGLVVARGLVAARQRRSRPEGASIVADDLDEVFARVDAEGSARFARLVRLRARDLIVRRVPVREIRTAPAPRVARVVFSNGVILLATSKQPGDLVTMAQAMLRTSVVLDMVSDTPEGPVLRFAWGAGQHVDVYAVGLDQAD